MNKLFYNISNKKVTYQGSLIFILSLYTVFGHMIKALLAHKMMTIIDSLKCKKKLRVRVWDHSNDIILLQTTRGIIVANKLNTLQLKFLCKRFPDGKHLKTIT